MVQLQAIPSQKIPVYPELPGYKIGPHDSLQLTDVPEGKKPDMRHLTWWHHADRPQDREVPKGSLCSVVLSRHAVAPGRGSLNKLEEGVQIYPSAWCGVCARHIWIRKHGAEDIHYRHHGWKPGEVVIAAEKEHYGRQCKGRERIRSVDCNGRKSYSAKSCRSCFNYHRRRKI